MDYEQIFFSFVLIFFGPRNTFRYVSIFLVILNDTKHCQITLIDLIDISLAVVLNCQIRRGCAQALA